MSKEPPIDAISSRSASVSAVLSLVSTWRAMVLDRSPEIGHAAGRRGTFGAPILPPSGGLLTVDGRSLCAARARSEANGVVAEGHAQLADHAVALDGELVGQAQHLVGGQVEE